MLYSLFFKSLNNIHIKFTKNIYNIIPKILDVNLKEYDKIIYLAFEQSIKMNYGLKMCLNVFLKRI